MTVNLPGLPDLHELHDTPGHHAAHDSPARYGAAMPRRHVHPLARAQRAVEDARTKLAQAEHDRDRAVADHSEANPELSYTDLSKLLDGGLSKTGVRYAIMRAARR